MLKICLAFKIQILFINKQISINFYSRLNIDHQLNILVIQGKYMDIEFDFKGDPLGGVISNCQFFIQSNFSP